MKITPDQMDSIYFRRNITNTRAGDITLDGNMMQVLFAVRDEQPASEILKQTGLDVKTVCLILGRLVELELLEVIGPKNRFLGEDFFKALENNLKKAIGPMAGILIDEAVEESGYSRNGMPVEHGAAVIRNIASEITDSRLKLDFIKIMAEFLR